MAATLSLVLVSDANYAHGLAVTLWSARRHLSRRVTLDARVMDGGLGPGDVAALEGILKRAGGPYRLTIVPAPHLKDLEQGYTTNSLTFARILAPDLFPDIDRALYLDVDLLVRRDLAQLLDLDLGGALVAAVQDIDQPTLGTRNWVGENLPIEEFGLPGDAPYFNSGVFFMDLAAWRAEDFGAKVLKLARSRPAEWVFWDQSPLNLMLHGRWKQLDESWNRQVRIDENRWQPTPLGPSILHFTCAKPWMFPLDRPIGIVRLYVRYLRASGWLEHRVPQATRRHPLEPGLVQTLREFKHWMLEMQILARRARAR